MFTGYKGAAKRLDDVDIPRIGAEIGVGEDELHAFMDVECAGTGFDAKGRVKMLFEPHVFWRELGSGEKRDEAVRQGLAYAKWAPGRYPADSYPRLEAALKIDERAALRSASWGLGQIMGFNAELCGYTSAAAMVRHFAEDEEHQLEAIVTFLKAKNLDKALRSHDWATIERVYNGGGHNGAYATRMANAYARWKKIKDTPWTPGQTPAPSPVAPVEPAAPVIVPTGDEPAVAPPPAMEGTTIAKWLIGALGLLFAALGAWLTQGGN